MAPEGLEKNPNWTWKTDLRYHVYQEPLEILKALIGIAQRDNILNEMGYREYLELAQGIADMKCGRYWQIPRSQRDPNQR